MKYILKNAVSNHETEDKLEEDVIYLIVVIGWTTWLL